MYVFRCDVQATVEATNRLALEMPTCLLTLFGERAQMPEPEVCNNRDDDCDTRIDEGTSSEADCTNSRPSIAKCPCVLTRE